MNKHTLTAKAFLALTFCSSLFMNAQNTFPSTGNVGIGTTDPKASLHIDRTTTAYADTNSVLLTGTAPSILLALSSASLSAATTGSAWAGMGLATQSGNFLTTATRGDLTFRTTIGKDMLFGTISDNTPTGVSERMRIKNNGYVGIGVSNPEYNLHIKGITRFDGGTLFNDANGLDGTKWGMYGWDNQFQITLRNADWSYSSKVLILDANGNMGVGSATPTQKLDVNGGAKISSLAGTGNRMVITDANGVLSTQAIPTGSGTATTNVLSLSGNNLTSTVNGIASAVTLPATASADGSETKLVAGTGITLSGMGTTANPYTVNSSIVDTDKQTLSITGNTVSISNGNSITLPTSTGDNLGNHTAAQNIQLGTFQLVGNGGTKGIAISNNGKVSIGTTNTPANVAGIDVSNYKLFVQGGILSDEVRVKTGWADYVFANNYTLKSIDDVAKYIEENKHLPNVPSAKEIESQGLNVGDMARIQQEKIEELTLYIIQLKKEVDALKADKKIIK